jgi:glycosyltransferase involved in cell wall biosynthesis
MKLITVITPVGSIDEFLIKTLHSIESQTYKKFLVLFVTRSSLHHDLVKFLIQIKFNCEYKVISTKLDGIAFAANLAIAEVDTPYIARWDADDLCEANRFQFQIDEMNANPSLAIIGTKVILIDESDSEIKLQKFKFYGSNEAIRSSLKYRCSLLHSSLLMRADVILKNKGYLYGNHSEDHELFLRVARDKTIQFKNLGNVLTYYRRHAGQLSDKSSSKDRADSFYDVSGFLFTEFLRSGHPYYLFGMLVIMPVSRRLRHYYRKLLGIIYRN